MSVYALRIVMFLVGVGVCRVVGWPSVDCKLAEMDCAICSQLELLNDHQGARQLETNAETSRLEYAAG